MGPPIRSSKVSDCDGDLAFCVPSVDSPFFATRVQRVGHRAGDSDHDVGLARPQAQKWERVRERPCGDNNDKMACEKWQTGRRGEETHPLPSRMTCRRAIGHHQLTYQRSPFEQNGGK